MYPEVAILGADQKESSVWVRECVFGSFKTSPGIFRYLCVVFEKPGTPRLKI